MGGIAENSHRGVAPIDADHAAARMRARSAQVDARHGRARRKPVGPHISRQALTLKNVTAGESDLPLDIRGTKHLRIDDGAVDIGAEAGQGVERELADFLPPLIPSAARELVWDILRKNAHCMLPGGRNGRILDTL